jgi:hypothetical protein
MTLMISISEDTAAKLKERASASGQPVPDYASRLVEQAIKSPTLDELLAPVQAEFAQSGMTEEELLNFGRGLLEKVRNEKKD